MSRLHIQPLASLISILAGRCLREWAGQGMPDGLMSRKVPMQSGSTRQSLSGHMSPFRGQTNAIPRSGQAFPRPLSFTPSFNGVVLAHSPWSFPLRPPVSTTTRHLKNPSAGRGENGGAVRRPLVRTRPAGFTILIQPKRKDGGLRPSHQSSGSTFRACRTGVPEEDRLMGSRPAQ